MCLFAEQGKLGIVGKVATSWKKGKIYERRVALAMYKQKFR